LAPDGGVWWTSLPGYFTLGEGTPSTQQTGGWVGPRAGLEPLEKRISLVPAGNGTPDCPHNSLVTIATVFIQKQEQAENRNYIPFRTDIIQEESRSVQTVRAILC